MWSHWPRFTVIWGRPGQMGVFLEEYGKTPKTAKRGTPRFAKKWIFFEEYADLACPVFRPWAVPPQTLRLKGCGDGFGAPFWKCGYSSKNMHHFGVEFGSYLGKNGHSDCICGLTPSRTRTHIKDAFQRSSFLWQKIKKNVLRRWLDFWNIEGLFRAAGTVDGRSKICKLFKLFPLLYLFFLLKLIKKLIKF